MMGTIKFKIDLLRPNLPFIIKDIIDRQYIIQPEFNRYGAKGIIHALEDAKTNIDYLLSSIEADSKLLFQQYNRWVNGLFTNLKLPVNSIEIFYICTKEVFKERFDTGLIDKELFSKINEFIVSGIESLKNEEYESISYFQEDNPFKELLNKYSEFIYAGNKISAIKLFTDISRSDIEIKDIYRYILQPFQLELGQLWHENKITVAQEHFATAISQVAMSLLYERIFSTPKNKKVFLGTCVQGELHEFGIRMICDYMEYCGWNTYYLGANMSHHGIIKMINEKKPDIITISCSMTFNISKVLDLIEAIKDSGISTPITVGGYPFNMDKSLWKKIGADASSSDFEEVYSMSENLCSSTGAYEVI
ncbi:cobalamin B12-binding domain-containing protein [Clostridium lacusfryxellense]|uniref:cobalamin B12-binding domain-containing protein n=1 Tax=Clostridium lacusfryxellense TaxID=205328 RepID=UPI001C0BF6F6|nr:cobalamin-dependent protein [Clostridium lacusfryxellense]MBU3113252.1 cobalamin-dependent protein [Clostridium lacusfryxellense]